MGLEGKLEQNEEKKWGGAGEGDESDTIGDGDGVAAAIKRFVY